MPRWEPKNEAEIELAIKENALAESHALDLKREFGLTDRARKEMACDLASFAVDGGALLVGVAEDKPEHRFSPVPQPLEGLVERVELSARQRVDPPLEVRPREIPSLADPARGYLWVDVPASPEAPHMVDGIYYGRGERTRQRLSDAEVVRLHERRRGAAGRVSAALDDEVSRDHLGPEHRKNGHLWVAAVPRTAPDELAVPLLASADPGFLLQAVAATDRFVPRSFRSYAPSVSRLSMTRRVAGGSGVSSYEAAGPGRTPQADAGGVDPEHNLVDLTVREDGQVRLTMGRATTMRGEQLVVLDGLVYAWVIRAAGLAGFVATRTGYRGSWDFAARVDRLRGAVSSAASGGDPWGSAPVYDREAWTATTTARSAEVIDEPRRVADRLLSSFLRALGSQPHITQA